MTSSVCTLCQSDVGKFMEKQIEAVLPYEFRRIKLQAKQLKLLIMNQACPNLRCRHRIVQAIQKVINSDGRGDRKDKQVKRRSIQIKEVFDYK